MPELMSFTDPSQSPWDRGTAESASRSVRRNGVPIEVGPLDDLLEGFVAANSGLARDERPRTDGYLSPRVHAALRLTRQEAADAGVWCWVASTIGHDYTEWRWAGAVDGQVARNRWRGPIHKQSLARLWWGAELFRNGPDYPRNLFTHQDTPNSVIHREFARCRPLAVAMDDVLAVKSGGMAGASAGAPTKDPLRRWFAAVNLYAGGRSLDALGVYHRDRAQAYRAWLAESPTSEPAAEPLGPNDGRVSSEARADSVAFLLRIWDEVARVGGEA